MTANSSPFAKSTPLTWLMVFSFSFFPTYFSLFTILSLLVSHCQIPLTSVTYAVLHLTTLVSLLYFFTRPSIARIFAPINFTRSFDCRYFLITTVLASIFLATLLTHNLVIPTITPPGNHDTGNHYWFINRILTTHSLNQSNIFSGLIPQSWYSLGFHNLLASFFSLTTINPTPAVVFLLVILTISIFPFAVTALARAIGVPPLTAALAAFTSLTFFIFPYYPFYWGGWTAILGITLLTFTLAHSLFLLRYPSSPLIFLVFLQLVTIAYVHPPEILTYFLIIIPTLIIYHHRLYPHRRFIKTYCILGVLGLICLLPQYTAAASWHTTLTDVEPQITRTLGDVLTYLYSHLITPNHNYLYNLMFCIGLISLWRSRNQRQLVYLTLFIFSWWYIRNTTTLLNPLFTLTFPWLEYERFIYTLTPFYALVTAAGFTAVTNLIARKLTLPPSSPKVSVSCLITVGLLLIQPLRATTASLKSIINQYSVTTPSDVALMIRNQHRCHLYAHETQFDASRWIPTFTSSQILFPGPFALLPDYTERLTLLAALQTENQATIAANLLDRYPVDCLYYGQKSEYYPRSRLSLAKLLSNPQLQLIDSQNGAFIFTPQATPASTLTESLPLTLSASDSLRLNQFIVGQVAPRTINVDNISYRGVSNFLDIRTQLSIKNITLIAFTPHTISLTCSVMVNGKLVDPLTFTPKPHLYSVPVSTFLPQYQNQLLIDCGQDISSIPHFAFSSISFL